MMYNTNRSLDKDFYIYLVFEFVFLFLMNSNLGFVEYWVSALSVAIPLAVFHSWSKSN